MSASTRKATLTATLMLGESKMGISRASRSISSRCAAAKPVVPMTARPPPRAAPRRGAGAAAPGGGNGGVAEARVGDGELDEDAVAAEHALRIGGDGHAGLAHARHFA